MSNEEPFSTIAFLFGLIDKLKGNTDCLSVQQEKMIDGLNQTIETINQLQEFDFREIGDYLYDGIYIANGNGTTLYVNKSYTRITGIQSEEILNKNVAAIEEEGLYKNAVTPEVIRQKKQVNSMAAIMRNGVKLLVTGNPVFDKTGNVKKVVVIDRDITDLLDMKADLEATQQKMKIIKEDDNKNRQEIKHLRKLQLNKNLVGQSPAIQQVVKAIHQIASLDVTVLITGETGTGKEVVANEIYRNSIRKDGPFIKVNCAAIPGNLLEAELFGYEKGAFTGASPSGKMGMFELANKGTILLDEIGEMPVELQSKLLRVLQDKEVTRIGGRKPIKLNVRILSATNVDLKKLTKQEKFREDLYYRLNVFPIHIPPLRSREEDIVLLTQHFLDVYNTKYGRVTVIERAGIELLKQYSWPGNIRELQNIIERLVIISDQNPIISAEQIGALLNMDPYYNELLYSESGLKEIVANIEKRTIEKVLTNYGSTRKAAKILKIDQSTIVRKAKQLGIKINMLK